MAGIEDLQVQFGIAAPGATNGRAVRYVDPGFAELPWTQVVSVRVWLRVRADLPERDFVDDAHLSLRGCRIHARRGQTGTTARVLIAKTLTRRNARAT